MKNKITFKFLDSPDLLSTMDQSKLNTGDIIICKNNSIHIMLENELIRIG